ncbi:MAG: redoxin domain-containing protein, partial [Nitrospirota bacterium]
MKMRFLLILILILIPVTAFSLSIGETAPDFNLKDLEGKDVSLKDFKGKVVFINFWATWCSPCKKEFPELNKFYETYKDNDLVVLAVNSDLKKGSVEDFLTKYPAKMT